jgi:hypothetical protein
VLAVRGTEEAESDCGLMVIISQWVKTIRERRSKMKVWRFIFFLNNSFFESKFIQKHKVFAFKPKKSILLIMNKNS